MQQRIDSAFTPAQLRRLSRRLETPCRIYDESLILERLHALYAAFSWNDGFRQYLPLRRCKSPVLLGLLRDAGCGVLCTDLSQLQLAQRCGFSSQALIYQPLRPQQAADELALSLDGTWAIDGEYVLPPRPPRRVLLRYHPQGKLRSGGKTFVNFDRIKTGMTKQELFDMLERFAAQDTEIGLMLSACENSLETGYYPAVAQTLFSLVQEIQQKTGVIICSCNLAGGFGVSGRKEFPSPDLNAAAQKIKELMHETLDPAVASQLRLQTALDRYLLAQAGVMLCSVLAVRQRELPMCLIDAPFEQSVLSGSFHPISALTDAKNASQVLYCVEGCQDVQRGGYGEGYVLPQLKPGDRLAIFMAGLDEVPDELAQYLLHRDGTLTQL